MAVWMLGSSSIDVEWPAAWPGGQLRTLLCLQTRDARAATGWWCRSGTSVSMSHAMRWGRRRGHSLGGRSNDRQEVQGAARGLPRDSGTACSGAQGTGVGQYMRLLRSTWLKATGTRLWHGESQLV